MQPYPRFRVMLAYFFSAGVAGFLVAILMGLYDLFKTIQPFYALSEHLLSVLQFGLVAALIAQSIFAVAALLLGIIACVFRLQQSIRHYLTLTILGALFSALTFWVIDFSPSSTLGFYTIMGGLTALLTARLCLPRNGICSEYDPH
ncbi:MAG: hypothetical protein KA214_04805 [Neisseriaceae bacterium]|nr:hypothetical protein [Neisseriaceae bacterium]